jgi:hypothetical protein
LDADKAECGEAHGRCHVAHLAVFAFDQCQFVPGCGNICPVTDRRIAVPKIFGFRDDFRFAFFCVVSLDDDSVHQFLDRLFGDLSFDLGKIGARMRHFGVEKGFDQLTIIGEQ